MTEIRASRTNLLFERMNLILGLGAGTNGYGQGQGVGYGPELSSYPVSNTPGTNLPVIVSAADINSLYADMLRCRIHQIGTEPQEIAEVIANLNVIAENTSFFIDDNGEISEDPAGNKKGITDFEQLMSQIETDKFLAHPSQMSVEFAIDSVRTTPWNGIITHEFTVSFRNADHRRHFFNSGGEIRFSASNNNSQTPKGQDWNNMLVNLETIKFDYEKTQSTSGSGIATSIGNYQLTSNYQLLFKKIRSGGVYGGGVYNGNEYTIEGRFLSDNQIRFRVRFADISDSLNNRGTDENVDGRLESVIRIFRASSETSVKVPAPTFNNNISLN